MSQKLYEPEPLAPDMWETLSEEDKDTEPDTKETTTPTFPDVMSNMRNLTQTLNQLQDRVADLNASNSN